jgi:hypothetical protein
VSSEVNSDVPEWASESVQIGSVGSAIGFIGIWTGADHERRDPIGKPPFSVVRTYANMMSHRAMLDMESQLGIWKIRTMYGVANKQDSWYHTRPESQSYERP